MGRSPRHLDATPSLPPEEAASRLLSAQRRLLELRLSCAGLLDRYVLGPPVVVVFEGFDAAGKGGAIRRLTASFDPRHVTVLEIGPPTAEERRHHFLWRFASALPGRGEFTVFDRSWYGRLLVERVEGLIDEETARWSQRHVIGFERGLVESGTLLVKLWLEISSDEQLRRFEARSSDPLKHWKLTEDDWHNRSLRPAYEVASDELLVETSTAEAPWDVIAAEHKHYARVAVLETVIARLEAKLVSEGLELPPPLARRS